MSVLCRAWVNVVAYLKRLLRRQDLAEKFAGTDTKSVSKKPDLLDIVHSPQLGDVRFQVGSCVQLQTLPLEGEYFVRGSHRV